MRPLPPPPSRLSRAAEGVLVVLLAGGPLALGGAPLWALGPGCVLALLALTLALLGARGVGQRLELPPFAGVLALGAATSALQLVPLPPWLLSRLSPRAADTVEHVLLPLGLSPVRPVSLDPPATWRALAAALAGLGVFLAAAHLTRERAARRRLLGALALAGAGVSLVGLVHWAAGLDALFGVHRFRHAHPPLLTPFGNPNHLAGFLTLTGTVGLGLSLSARERGRQVLWGAAAFLCAVGLLSSLSRGGILAWGVGLLLLAALLWRRRRLRRVLPGESVPLHLRAWVAVLFLGALFAGGLYASERLTAELATLTEEGGLERGKLEFWPMFARAALEFLPLGMGRGAFEAAFPRFHTEAWRMTFTHPENVVLQLVAEQGLPVGLALVLGALGCFLAALRRPSLETTDLAVLAGVAALCAQNLVDFSLELPAVGHAALAAFGVVCRREAPRDAVGGARWPGLRPGPAVALVLALAAVALLALIPGRWTLAAAEEEVLAALRQGRPVAEVRALAVAHLDRHPTAWALPSAVAHAHAARPGGEPREALAFANRALLLFPGDAHAHASAARALLRLQRREQAFLEYRLAWAAGRQEALLDEALARARSTAELSQLTPDDVRLAERVAHALQRAGRFAEALAYVQAMQARFVEADAEGRARLSVAEARLHLKEGALGPAAEACERAGRLAPGALPVELARAELLRALGRGGEAVALLEGLVAKHPGEVELLLALAHQQLARREPRLAREALTRAAPFVTRLAQRARLLDAEARSYELEGTLHRALDAWRTAARLVPSASRSFAVARLHERLGRPGEALEALREGMALEPGGGSAQSHAWRERLEARARARRDEALLRAEEAGR